MKDATPGAGASPRVVELAGPYRHEMLHTRGLRLHAAIAGEPTAPLIVLLHGALGGWFDYRRVIAPLAARGFCVAALDLRGYGLSDKPALRAGDPLLLAVGDVKGAIATMGHDSAVVVGSGVGGSVAWALAATHPERVDALVSLSSAHPCDLRRAAARRPWDFVGIAARAGGAGVYLNERFRARTYRANLLVETGPDYHGSAPFAEDLRLRLAASGIANTLPYVRSNLRGALRRPPRRVDRPVVAPTLILRPGLALWNPLTDLMARRVTGAVQVASIRGAKNLPHLEAPELMAHTIADVAQKHGSAGAPRH